MPGKILHLLKRFSVEAAVQDPCVAICTRCLQEISTEDLCKGSQSKISVQAIYTWSPSKTFALFTRSQYEIPKIGLLAKPLYKISTRALCWQDLCKRPLGKISVQISIRGLLVRSLYEIPAQTLYKSSLGKIAATNLYAMSQYKVSMRGVLARSPYKISIRGLLARSLRGLIGPLGKIATDLYAMSLCKISTRGLLARSLYKISIRALLARSL